MIPGMQEQVVVRQLDPVERREEGPLFGEPAIGGKHDDVDPFLAAFEEARGDAARCLEGRRVGEEQQIDVAAAALGLGAGTEKGNAGGGDVREGIGDASISSASSRTRPRRCSATRRCLRCRSGCSMSSTVPGNSDGFLSEPVATSLAHCAPLTQFRRARLHDRFPSVLRGCQARNSDRRRR